MLIEPRLLAANPWVTRRPITVTEYHRMGEVGILGERAVKRALYARHGISEIWIIDLNAGEVEVCRQPGSDGYAAVTRIGRDGVLEPEMLPGVRIQAATLFR